MSINSVSSSNNYASPVQPKPQTQAERATEIENDKDSDDGSKAAAVNAATPKPTVNTNGQTVGALLNVQA